MKIPLGVKIVGRNKIYYNLELLPKNIAVIGKRHDLFVKTVLENLSDNTIYYLVNSINHIRGMIWDSYIDAFDADNVRRYQHLKNEIEIRLIKK